MTKEQKHWYKRGLLDGKDNPDEHPEQIIQEDWNAGIRNNAVEVYDGFSNWLDYSKSWASGVRKGSKYFENH